MSGDLFSPTRPGPEPEPAPRQTAIDFVAPPPPETPAAGVGVRLDVDVDEVGWIVFDLPGEKVNKLTTPVMEALRDLLDEALRRKVRGLVFVSGKPGTFIAGADVAEIATLPDARAGAEKAAWGQAVFEAIARFPRPTAAVVTGACLGGGYELALATGAVIAEDLPAVSIGLPETRIGILPGLGGTQRLPRRAGLTVALDLILSGKTLPAKAAHRRGLADALVPAGIGRDVARAHVLGTRPIRRRAPRLAGRVIARVAPLRRAMLAQARRRLAARVRPEHYPSPFMAREAIEAGFAAGEIAAYGHEARLLGEAAVTPAGRNLARIFLDRGAARRPAGLDMAAARPSTRLAVVGAGVMGGGIAWLAAERGFPIRVKDVRAEALTGALAAAGKLWNAALAKRRLTPRERDRRLERLSFTLDFAGFRTVDAAIEAVVEDLEVKRGVVAALEGVLPAEALLASNTSSLRIGDIAAGARRPERIVGLHFFNPVDRMPLVEVVRGPASAPWAVAAACRLALDLDKTPILTSDTPGFLVNRLLAFYLGEAVHLLESGAEARAIDGALADFGMPVGPLALLDAIGLDVADKVVKTVKGAFGDRLPPQATIGRLAAEGHFGRKRGRGFYVYDARGKPQGPAPEATAAAGRPAARAFDPGEIVDRVLLPMVNEAARCLEEGVVARPLDVDLGMVLGTGFPPFRGGLLRWADARGVPAILSRLEAFTLAMPRYAPSEALRARGAGFHAS